MYFNAINSGAIDPADIRGACDEEEGRVAGSDAVQDEDSPSPPRVYRRFSNKRGGGVSAARRNGAFCLALCVSAASLVWIIARGETGATIGGEGILESLLFHGCTHGFMLHNTV